jgi:hypothetical protein
LGGNDESASDAAGPIDRSDSPAGNFYEVGVVIVAFSASRFRIKDASVPKRRHLGGRAASVAEADDVDGLARIVLDRHSWNRSSITAAGRASHDDQKQQECQSRTRGSEPQAERAVSELVHQPFRIGVL